MTFLLRWIAFAVGVLPYSVQRALAAGMGSIFCAIGWRSRVVRQNLDYAFPGSDKAGERERIFRESYRNFGLLVFEVLLLLAPFGLFRRRIRMESELRGRKNWEQASALGKGVIFVSSHVGNWEVMAATGALSGMDLMIVTKHLRPESLHRAFERARLNCQVRATYEPRTFRDVLSHLKAGGTVGFVLDQYAGAPVGVRVPVFGVPVGTMTAPAILAKRTGAPVLPVVNYRTAGGRFVVDVRPAVSWKTDSNPQREIALNTAHYASVLEDDIRRHPEQWLWVHRRFKGNLNPLTPDEWDAGRSRR